MQVDPDLVRVPVNLSHGFVNPDWPSMVKAVELFDHPEKDDIPDTTWAEKAISDMFKDFGIHSKVLDLDGVEFNERANAGVGYQEMYGNKGRNLMFNREEIQLYWKMAHVVNAWPLSYMFGKVEYLPWEKVLDNNTRSIECAPITHLAFQLRLCQAFNKLMYNKCDFLNIVVGVTFSNGGFDRLLKRITRVGGTKGMGDVRKWDKYFGAKLRNACKRIRIACYQLSGERHTTSLNREYTMSADEFQQRMEFVYWYSHSSPVLTPWGQVLVLLFMKSGDGNTTSDNSIGHAVIWFTYIFMFVPRVSHWRDVLNVLGSALYADDHLFDIVKEYAFLAPYTVRAEFYALFGFTLKQEDDVIQQSWIGLKFLGAKIGQQYGQYVPIYDLGRIWSSIVYNRVLDPVGLYNKLCSLLLLSTFNGKRAFNQLRLVLLAYVKLFDSEYGLQWTGRRSTTDEEEPLFKKGLPFIPTYEWAVNFWLGFEDAGLGNQASHARDLFDEHLIKQVY